MTTTQETQLSKWWMTESCKRAQERAKQARDARIAKVRAAFAARKAKLEADAMNWEVVE